MKIRSIIFLLFALVLVASVKSESDYVQSIVKWRSDEEADLKKENGWLTLVGLFWLKDGVNTIGAGSTFDVRLTDNFKEGKFGEIEFKNGVATLRVEKGIEALSEGQPVSTIALHSDDKGKPTEIQTGSQRFYLIQRDDRFGIRLKDSQSKARVTFKGQQWFPIDESYKVDATLDAYPEPKEVMVPNVLGGHFKMKSPGILKFSLKGKDYSLQPVNEDDGSLFLIFRDASNSTATDETGRFLYAEKAVNGKTVLDFNKAENPPCAFTPFATCPLAPPGNELQVAISAGEKRYQP
ncbi:MAG: DUF1684 domain-containing protein [Chthoniobacterales bacterium]|nr:DUF1684 domain-containing protein [Chthoniobacterales bacterium]